MLEAGAPVREQERSEAFGGSATGDAAPCETTGAAGGWTSNAGMGSSPVRQVASDPHIDSGGQ